LTPQLEEHIGYLRDSHRLRQYRRAVKQVVRPGDRVLDLGCGTGILGLLCLEAGATHVHAVDATAMAEVARRSFAQAGFGSRATIHHGWSTQVEPGRPVDVVICDQVGYFGFDAGLLEYLADARARLLAPGGRLVPNRLELWAAPISSSRAFDRVTQWTRADIPGSFHWIAELAANNKHPVDFAPGEIAGPEARLCSLELGAAPGDFLECSATLEVREAGVVHGIGGWFRAELAPDVEITNSPLARDRIDRAQAFMPLASPIEVRAGDTLEVAIVARPADGILTWRVRRAGQTWQTGSTWAGMPIGPEELRQRDPRHAPVLRARAQARLAILSLCDGSHSVAEIEEITARNHPQLFAAREQAAAFVAKVLSTDAT
jgi:protein arginine N-methyltransferase 1